MIKTILICLVAVVVIIIVIGLLFRLFLRADDSDAFDELAAEPRRPSRTPDEPRPRKPAAREPVGAAASAARRPPARKAPADDRPRPAGRGPEDRGQSGYRDRQGPDRAAGPDHRASQGNGHGRSVPAGERPAKPPRPAEPAAQSAKWDKMSDVDYWAELASDKPLTTTTAASASPAEPAGRGSARRRTPEPAAEARPAGRSDQPAHLPVRQRQPRPAPAPNGRPADFSQPLPAVARSAHAPGRYAGGSSEPATQSIAALARLGSQPRPTTTPPPPSQPRQQSRPMPPPPLDDDPLTSPSFPAINASDSRSYRASRSDSQPRRVPSPPPAYSEPTQQFSSYPPATDRGTSQPNGYPVQPAAPAGNPYGSFVSQPAPSYQAPAASHQDTSYPSRDAGYGQPAQPAQPGNDWYGGNGQTSQQSLPAFSSAPPPAPASYVNDVPGYQPTYQGGQTEAAGYAQPGYPGGQYDQRGYGQEPGYGADGHQGYTGYTTGGY